MKTWDPMGGQMKVWFAIVPSSLPSGPSLSIPLPLAYILPSLIPGFDSDLPLTHGSANY